VIIRRAPDDSQARPAETPAPKLYQIVICFALFAAYWYVNWQRIVDGWREDLPVYRTAVHAWLTGGDPYSLPVATLHFLYPPAFLVIAGFFAHLIPSGWGENLYTALHVAATVALPLVLMRWYFRFPWLTVPFALLLFFASPNFTSVRALCTLNIASTAYCVAFLAAVPGLKRERWIWFYLAVLVVASIKIIFLSLLLLPLLAGKRQWRRCFLCGAAVIGVNILEKVVAPGLYAGYQSSLVQGIVNQGYYGFGLFAIVAAYGYKLHIPLPLGAYAAAALQDAVLVGVLLYLKYRLRRVVWTDNMRSAWLALIVTAVILVNPRLLQYDADISLFAAGILWIYGLRSRQPVLLIAVICLPSLFMWTVVKALHLYGMYGTLETLGAFGLVAWQMARLADAALDDAKFAKIKPEHEPSPEAA
jgi:hypothetical protein